MEFVTNKNEEIKLDEINKTNLKEAKKQFDEEKSNAEIAFAKKQLLEATNFIDEANRRIKSIKEEMKPYQKIIKQFN